MTSGAASLWVYLASTPLLWLTVTVLAFLVADWLAQRAGRHPVANPVLFSILIVGMLLSLTGTSYQSYFSGAQFVHFLLGPAVVAIGVPLCRHFAEVRRNILPMMAALIAGTLTAIVSVIGIAAAFGVPKTILISLAPKSVTAGVAMGISEQLGGVPALTAVLVIFTGITGAVLVTPLMNALGITNFAARGFAVGVASHGIGTARAFAVSPVAGVFAGLAMGLSAIASAILVPLAVTLLP